MKTKIFILTLLLFSISFIKGQDYEYIPFVEEGKHWSYAAIYMVGYIPGGGQELKASYSTYQIKGDTTINGLDLKSCMVDVRKGIGALEEFYPLRPRSLHYEYQGINYQKKGTDLVYKTDKWYFNENDCEYKSGGLNYFLPKSNAVMSILDHKYWFEGDTIINDILYTKIYRQKCQSETECGELSYYGAVREDIINEKYYAIYPCDSAMLPYSPYICSEVLLADFDVKAGDQIEIYPNWPGLYPQTVTVKNVDSMMIDNQYRKRINLNNEGWHPDSWVEGIGSIVFGLFFPSPERVIDLGDVPKLLCMHVNGELLYQEEIWGYGACFAEDSGTGIPSVKSPEGIIYYSIENEKLYLHDNYAYQIYDLHGSLVLFGRNSSTAINISQLVTGIYLLRLLYDGKPVYSGKFLKQ